MSRSLFSQRGDKYVGEFPPEGGWQKGRRGIRRTLCSAASVSHLSDMERQMKLMELYQVQARKIQRQWETEKEAKKKKKRQKKSWTVRQACNQWIESVKAESNSKNTHQGYRRSVDLYIQANGNHVLADYESSHHTRYLNYLKSSVEYQGKKIGASTQNKHVRHFRIFVGWCYDNELLDRIPRLKAPKVQKKDMDTYEIEDLEKIRCHIESELERGIAEENRRLVRDMKNARRVWWLATYSLLRLGAIWALPIDNIDLRRGLIRIRDNQELNWQNKKRKWPNKPISPKLAKFLKQDLKSRGPDEKYYLDKGDGQPWFYDRGDISTLFGELCQACNLPKLKPLHWGFRATMITHLLNNGADLVEVQQLADHDDINTTLDYRDTRRSDQRKAADQLDDLI